MQSLHKKSIELELVTTRSNWSSKR